MFADISLCFRQSILSLCQHIKVGWWIGRTLSRSVMTIQVMYFWLLSDQFDCMACVDYGI